MVIGRGGSTDILCECDAKIPRSELVRCLPIKIYERLLKLETEHELKTAGFDLAHCPCLCSVRPHQAELRRTCGWLVDGDDPADKLVRCQRKEVRDSSKR